MKKLGKSRCRICKFGEEYVEFCEGDITNFINFNFDRDSIRVIYHMCSKKFCEIYVRITILHFIETLVVC